MIDRRLLALAPEAMKHIVLTVVWLMAGLAANIALVYGIAALLAALIQGSAVPVQETLLLCVVAFVLKIVSAQLSSNERFRAARDVKRLLRERIYEKLLKLGPSYTKRVSTAEVVQVSVEGTEQLETYFGQYLPQLIYAVLAPIVLFFVIAPIHVPTATSGRSGATTRPGRTWRSSNHPNSGRSYPIPRGGPNPPRPHRPSPASPPKSSNSRRKPSMPSTAWRCSATPQRTQC